MRILAFLLAGGIVAGQSSGAASDENSRRLQLMQLANKPDLAACVKIEASLTDASADIRQRAASALYWRCDRVRTGERAVQALSRSVEMGNANAGALLLLGYAPRKEAEARLQKPLPGWAMVKLATSAQPVPASLAARVALARLGDETAIAELRKSFAKASIPEALFLLTVLPDINDRGALEAAIALLGDARECPGVDSESKRRVQDAALEALVDRFKLATSFKIERGREYTDAELAEARGLSERAR
jgi:hypothetical protein